MFVKPSQEEYRPSTLSVDSRISIQSQTEDWLGSFGLETSGDSLSTLRSGINLIQAMIDIHINTSEVASEVYEGLGMGDGDVDLVALAIQRTKRMVKDVLIELKADLGDH